MEVASCKSLLDLLWDGRKRSSVSVRSTIPLAEHLALALGWDLRPNKALQEPVRKREPRAAKAPKLCSQARGTIGISFGASRELAFRHATTGELTRGAQERGQEALDRGTVVSIIAVFDCKSREGLRQGKTTVNDKLRGLWASHFGAG